MLNIINTQPETLLTAPPTALHSLFPGPTLIHIPGHRTRPLFVSVLLHGNETSGYFAIQTLLKKYHNSTLPRALSLFIGNIQAAKYGKRRLDNQVDYNRIWPHHEFTPSAPETEIMRQVVDEMRRRQVFLSIDIHNNTGLNPHYACINRRDNAFYQLAVLFSRTVIYFTRPQGVQSQAFAELCPAVTIECGKAEHQQGANHAMQYIESCLGLDHLPKRPIRRQDIDLFHTVATVNVPQNISISFTGRQNTHDNHSADLRFVDNVEKLNFSELAAGSNIGVVNQQAIKPLSVTDEQGTEAYNRFFEVQGNRLQTRCGVMPSMLTTDTDIIRKDCLCYLMERLHV